VTCGVVWLDVLSKIRDHVGSLFIGVLCACGLLLKVETQAFAKRSKTLSKGVLAHADLLWEFEKQLAN
jgi:hypothetical protein